MVGQAVHPFHPRHADRSDRSRWRRARLIHAVQDGNSLIIFPEGRLTVTGSLMKVYDGAGLIADKSDAMIVPVRIDGLEDSPFTRLTRRQVRRRLFPEGDGHGPGAGQARSSIPRCAARNAGRPPAPRSTKSCRISSSAPRRSTAPCSEALIEAALHQRLSPVAIEDPVTGTLSYRRLLRAVRDSRREADAARRSTASRSA